MRVLVHHVAVLMFVQVDIGMPVVRRPGITMGLVGVILAH
jgi:hypothetical protein